MGITRATWYLNAATKTFMGKFRKFVQSRGCNASSGLEKTQISVNYGFMSISEYPPLTNHCCHLSLCIHNLPQCARSTPMLRQAHQDFGLLFHTMFPTFPACAPPL